MLLQRLTKGKNSWSLSEVVHAMVLLSHFHSLSSFVFSCGLTQKLDGLSSPKLKSPPAAVAALAPTILITPTSPTEPQKGKPVLAEISLNNANPDYDSQTAASSNGGAPPDSANAVADGPDATTLNGYLGEYTQREICGAKGISIVVNSTILVLTLVYSLLLPATP